MSQALDYHEFPRPGKLAISPTKPLANQHDLALAYSPGVAEACLAIVEDARNASRYTARGNLIAVVSNGTAVLGLGNIGPLAAKPVMEGKAVLFKKFAGIDVFDIELAETDPEKLADIDRRARAQLRRHQPRGHQSARLLRGRRAAARANEDPGAARRPARHGDRRRRHRAERAALRREGDRGHPDRLDRRRRRRHRLSQFVAEPGRAAGKRAADRSQGRRLRRSDRRDDAAEAGLCPTHGGANARRRDPWRRPLPGPLRSGHPDARDGGRRWPTRPIILALANPVPEIMPDVAKAARPDAIIATGRSDFPNQVNNLLCFPFIFKGALDVGATAINEAMKIACVQRSRRPRHAGILRDRRPRLRRRGSGVRPRVPDPQAVRSAAAGRAGTGSRPGCDGLGRRHPADRGLRRLSRAARALRLSLADC